MNPAPRPAPRLTAPVLAVLARFVLALGLLALVLPGLAALPARTASAADPAAQVAKWKQEERQCISKCPKFPRYGGSENARQYKKRIQAEDAYNTCYNKCTRDYMYKLRMKVDRMNDGSEGYYKRNGVQP